MLRANMLRFSRFALPAALAAVLLVVSSGVAAQRVEGDRASASGAFSAEVPVNSQAEGDRGAAMARALAQVLAKQTGDRGVTGRPGVGQELRRAKDYASRFDYRQDEGVSASGAPSFRTTLVVEFDADKVGELINTLGLPVWPQPRPKPVLWLAIDDGKGARLVGLNQSNAAKPVLERATQRGYKLGLPSGNAAEQAVVGAIWRGDSAAVARASARYSPPMQLIGKLYRNDKAGWKADWIFVDDGKVLNKWSSEEADARRAMAAGADGAADALTRRYSKAAKGAGPAGRYRVTVTGIDSTNDFLRLAGYLQKEAVVRRITPVRASADSLVLELELVSGLAGFKRSIEGDGVLDPVGDADATVYRLR